MHVVVARGAVGQPDVREAVRTLLRALGLEPDQAGAQPSQQLAAVKRALSEQVLPALKDVQQQRQGQQEHKQGTGDAAANGSSVLDLAQFPLGFSTGGTHASAVRVCWLSRRAGHGMHACMPLGHHQRGLLASRQCLCAVHDLPEFAFGSCSQRS